MHITEKSSVAIERPTRTRFEQEIAKILGVSVDELPRIHMHFSFVRHHTKQDSEWLGPHIASADVVLLETAGISKEGQMAMHLISQGEETFNTAMTQHNKKFIRSGQGGFDIGLQEYLFGTKKAVMAVDVPSNSPLDIQVDGSVEEMQTFEKSLKHRRLSFEAALAEYARLYTSFSVLQRSREEHIDAKFATAVAHALKHHKELMTKESIQVECIYGSAHSRMHVRLKQRHERTTRSFPHMPYHYPASVELSRRIGYGKSGSERAHEVNFIINLAEGYVWKHLNKAHKNRDLFPTTRRFFHSLSSSEIRSLYVYMQCGDTKGFEAAVVAKLKKYLSSK